MYPYTWKTIIRNSLYRRQFPIVSLLVALTRRNRRRRFRQMLVAEVQQHRYVHVWGAFGGNPSASIFGVH